jgi:hypothetical protein
MFNLLSFHQKGAHSFKFYCEKNFENIGLNSIIRNYETNAKTEDKKEYQLFTAENSVLVLDQFR